MIIPLVLHDFKSIAECLKEIKKTRSKKIFKLAERIEKTLEWAYERVRI